METAIEIRRISKRYKNVHAIHELSLTIPKGKVYGLLGENGAGKTTTLRIVTGLIRPDSGQVIIHGDTVRIGKANTASNIGAIIESPGLYRNLTAADNICIAARLHRADINQARHLLKVVGLDNASKKKVKHFSTGMKQRLGIGCALVHSPKILILDEPTVGLDPQGVIDLRRLIRQLAENMNMTVVISSHILAEIEQVADMAGILHKGKLIEEFDMSDLTHQEQEYLLLAVDNTQKTKDVLKKHPWKFVVNKNEIMIHCPSDRNGEINQILASEGIRISSMQSIRDTLEQRFLHAVRENATNQ